MAENINSLWFISKYAITPTRGNPSRQYYLVKYFAKKGYKTSLFSSQSSNINNYIPQKGLFDLETQPNLNLYLISGPKINLGFSLKRMWSWLVFEINLLRLTLTNNQIHKPKIIIVSSLSLLSFLSGVILSWRYKAKLILEVRDVWPLSLIEVGGFSPYNPLVLALRFIEKFGYRHADAIVGTMPNLKQHIRNSIKKQVPVFFVPQGYDHLLPPTLKLTDKTLAKYNSIKKSKFNIIYSGTIGKANNIDLILDVASIFDENKADIHFVIMGDGALKETYQNKYQHLNNLSFVSPIPANEVPLFLSNFDLLICPVEDKPIYRFGLSLNKIIDYMRSGRPILMCYSGYPSLIDGEKYSFTVPAKDINALVIKITEVKLMSREELNKMGNYAKDIVAKHHTFESLSEEYVKILESIIHIKA